MPDPLPTPEQAARQSLEASFTGKLCPYLTIAGLRQGGSGLVGAMGTPVGGQESEAIGCQGQACMLFVVTSADKQGRPCAGACALALLPAAIGQVAQVAASLKPQQP